MTAGAPVPTTSTPFRFPALKSVSVSCVHVAARALGHVTTRTVRPSRTTNRTTTTRDNGDRDIPLNLLPQSPGLTAGLGSSRGLRGQSGGRGMCHTFLIVSGPKLERGPATAPP